MSEMNKDGDIEITKEIVNKCKKDIEKELSLTEKMTTFKGKLNTKKDIFESPNEDGGVYYPPELAVEKK